MDDEEPIVIELDEHLYGDMIALAKCRCFGCF